jgi:probable AcnD-accessory protein PrpF
MQKRFPAVYMRGGTSKGLFFHEKDLPTDPQVRDQVILRATGSPDPFRRQVDGLGGATSSTSKAVIISKSDVPGCDVNYLFGQVGIDKPYVDYKGSCGNLSAAVGPFAIEEGLVPATEGETIVRIWQVNTKKRIIARVPTAGGLPMVDGDYRIDGIPYPGALIRLEYLSPGGSVCSSLLPTGRVTDVLEVPGVGSVEVTLLDAANPVVFVRAADLGLLGTESSDEIDARADLLKKLEAIRCHGAVAMGLATSIDQVGQAIPKMAFVSPAAEYLSRQGQPITKDSIDVVGRVMSMGRCHQAYAATVAIATVIASLVPGTLVNQAAGITTKGERTVRLGHPSGIIEIGAEVVQENGLWTATKAVSLRTARRLMEGSVLVPQSALEQA